MVQIYTELRQESGIIAIVPRNFRPATIWQSLRIPLPKNETDIKKTIDLDFSDMLETCLRFARVRVRIISEIIEKGVDKKYERTIEILRNSNGEDSAEQRLREEFGISRAAARAILDSPLRSNIVADAQDYLEYYREAAEKLTAVLSKNPEKQSIII